MRLNLVGREVCNIEDARNCFTRVLGEAGGAGTSQVEDPAVGSWYVVAVYDVAIGQRSIKLFTQWVFAEPGRRTTIAIHRSGSAGATQ